MATHFSANQYEDAFGSKKLQNWTVPHTYKERPSSLEGYTQIIANDRGHLLPGAPRSKESPWGSFVGTWDMPKKIPGNVTTYMARSDKAIEQIETTKFDHELQMQEAVAPPRSCEKATSPVPAAELEEAKPPSRTGSALASPQPE
ncbi:protein Flattop homolog [Ptychodera flava]|uniref:protein Flattop homolog n=1 Tax=Ptychodera flava TaxID=63121 RepID=UPI003969FBCE